MATCEICNKAFKGKVGKANRFCTLHCYWKSMKGKLAKNMEGLKLGRGWNKGITGENSHVYGNDWGFQETKKISLYKENKNKYLMMHKRWYKIAGKAMLCSLCGNNKNVQWHNISGEYLPNIDDWIQVCAKCHFAVDERRAGK